MGKSRKKYRRKRTTPLPMVPVMLGLALIGVAILAMSKSESQAVDPSSVVPMTVNFAAPELSLQNIQGQTESFTDYRNQVVLVNNWATWCPPCRAEMPTLAAYYNEHESDGFTIIAIEAGDPVEGVTQFVRSYGLRFPVWLDPDDASLRAFGNGTLPNSYVIDRSGTVRLAWTGQISKSTLEEYVTPLLKEN